MSNLLSNKKYHYLYKTVNKVNGKYYYGMHSTNNLEDGYLGSGTALRAAFRKHGKENFELTILEYFDSRESLVEAEKSLVTEEEVVNKDCYNLKQGGRGGTCSDLHYDRWVNARHTTHVDFWKEHGRRWREQQLLREKVDTEYREGKKEKQINTLKQYFKEKGGGNFLGKKHSESTRSKISKALEGKQKGNSNSQYGTCWITNGVDSKKVKHLSKIPKGWRLGRVIKK